MTITTYIFSAEVDYNNYSATPPSDGSETIARINSKQTSNIVTNFTQAFISDKTTMMNY